MIKLTAVVFFITAASLTSQQSSNMRLLAHFPNKVYSSSCWGYESAGREYAIYGWYYGTSIVDITDDRSIREVAFVPGRNSGWREMKVFKNYLYVVSEAEGSGLQVIDLSGLPGSVKLLNTYFFEGFTRAHTISVSGNYLYLNGGDYSAGGITVLDIGRNPALPQKVGEWESDYVHDCRVINDTIWACNPLTGRISVINAVKKSMLSTITSWVNGQNPVPHNCALTAGGTYLYVCDENFTYPGKLKIWNVSDKRNITFVTDWSVEGTNQSVHNIEIFGNYAFLAYYGEGLRVLDITKATAPVEIAWYKTSACWQIYYFNSGKIIASDIYDGLYVLMTEEPITVRNAQRKVEKVSLKQNYPNPFNPLTQFEFTINDFTEVRLVIYNALGKEIKTLVNRELEQGDYAVEFDGTDLPSGIYYYSLKAGNFFETKKMVLVK